MTGATIAIDDATANDTILSVKRRVFARNNQMFVRRQRLVYQPGPYGMDPLADDETLGGAGVTQDGSAKLDVLLENLSEEQAAEVNKTVRSLRSFKLLVTYFHYLQLILYQFDFWFISHCIPLNCSCAENYCQTITITSM